MGKDEKVFKVLPYNVYRWIVCATVMSVLIPMAGTMTSFGAIKKAVVTTKECVPVMEKAMRGISTEVVSNKGLNCTNGTQDIEDWNKIGYEDVSDVVLSLVGSLVFGFTVGASFLSSPIIAKLGYQKTGMIGVTTGIISLCLTAWSPSFWWWFLTYSVMFGLSNNLLYNTGMQMCNAFFPTEYNTAATVLASFGISLGTMIMTPVTIWLTDAFGWRYRFFACAGILACLGYPCCLLWTQPRTLDATKKSNKEKDEDLELIGKAAEATSALAHPADTMNLFTSVVFWSWLVGTTLWSLDFVIPLDFAIGFMTDNGIARIDAGAVMSALGVSELISRSLCAITGEQKVLSKPMIYIIFSFAGALACVLPIVAYNLREEGESISLMIMYAYAIIVGFCGGVLNCLIMACTVDIFGQKRTVEVWNYVNLMLGLGFVGGPPIGAWFTTQVVDDLVYVFYLAVAFFVGCGVVMLPIPSLMKKLQPAKVDQNGNNNNNRGDCELES